LPILRALEDDVEVVESALMSVSQVLGHTCLDERAWVESDLLGNHGWVEDVPDLDLAVLEEGNQIW
jgi:hypothetical protein